MFKKIFRRQPFKLLALLGTCGLILCSCVTIYDGEKPEWNIKTASQRLKEHPLPKIWIVYNDCQLGWLYNDGVRFSDSAFKRYVYGLDIAKGCKDIKFFYGITRHSKKVIRGAVIFI